MLAALILPLHRSQAGSSMPWGRGEVRDGIIKGRERKPVHPTVEAQFHGVESVSVRLYKAKKASGIIRWKSAVTYPPLTCANRQRLNVNIVLTARADFHIPLDSPSNNGFGPAKGRLSHKSFLCYSMLTREHRHAENQAPRSQGEKGLI
jgi:hypothetical protein